MQDHETDWQYTKTRIWTGTRRVSGWVRLVSMAMILTSVVLIIASVLRPEWCTIYAHYFPGEACPFEDLVGSAERDEHNAAPRTRTEVERVLFSETELTRFASVEHGSGKFVINTGYVFDPSKGPEPIRAFCLADTKGHHPQRLVMLIGDRKGWGPPRWALNDHRDYRGTPFEEPLASDPDSLERGCRFVDNQDELVALFEGGRG